MKKTLIILMCLLMLVSVVSAAQDTRFGSRWVGGSLILYPPDHPQQAYLVNASVARASDSNPGKTWDAPLATWDGAINKCSAGDSVYCGPGHTETFATAGAVTLDVAGVKTTMLGEGSKVPTFTFATLTPTDIEIDAADNTIKGGRFIGDIDSLIAPFDVDAAYFTMDGCELIDNGTDNTITWVQTDANADNMTLRKIINKGTDTAGNESFVSLVGCDRARIIGCESTGNFSVANIEFKTTTPTDTVIDDNYLENANAVDVNISTMVSCTGVISRNRLRIATDSQVTWISPTDTTGMSLFENYGVNSGGETGRLVGTASI